MLKFIANLFGKKHEAPVAPTPYKVEASLPKPVKKATVKKATTAKPKKPKSPKA